MLQHSPPPPPKKKIWLGFGLLFGEHHLNLAFHPKNQFIFLSLKIKCLGKNQEENTKPSKVPRGGIYSLLNEQKPGVTETTIFCPVHEDYSYTGEL